MALGEASKSRSLPLVATLDEARLQTWGQLLRTCDVISRQIAAAVARLDVTLPQFDVLATLRVSEGVTQQELAERLLVSKGNVCGVLDRLEDVGWVERRPDAADRRANRLYLTAAGRRKVASVLPLHNALVIRALQSLSAGQIKSLRPLLEELVRANQERAQP